MKIISISLLVFFSIVLPSFSQSLVDVSCDSEFVHVKVALENNSLFSVSNIVSGKKELIGVKKFLLSGPHNFKIKKEVLNSEKLVFSITSYEAKYIKTIGSFGSGMGNFFHPIGICKDRLDRIYISDSNNDRIQVINKNGGYISEFGVFDWAEHNFFESSDDNSFNDDSEFIDAAANLNNPVDLTVGQFIYVVDKGNNRVVKFNNDYSFIKYFGKYGNDRMEFVDISSITIDDNENLYIVDTGNDRIVKTDSNGRFLFEIGSFGRGQENFNKPQSVAVDSKRNIFVADSGNKKIKVFDAQGIYQYDFLCKTFKDIKFVYSWQDLLLLIDSEKKILYLTDAHGRKLYSVTLKSFIRPESCVIIDDRYLFVTDSESNNIKVFEIIINNENFTRKI